MRLCGELDWSSILKVHNNIFDEEVLQHHGILGMKWGVRKSRQKNNQLHVKIKTVDEAAREKQFISEYKNRDKMSTKQLQARVNRLRAEKEFRKLAYEDEKARVEKAKKEKAEKRKRNLKIASAVITTAANNLPVEKLIKLDKSKFSTNEAYQKAYKKELERLGMLKTSGKSIGEFLGKMAQSDVYIPGKSNPNDFLQHYGVIGMHWGARRQAVSKTKHLKKAVKLQKKIYKNSKRISSLHAEEHGKTKMGKLLKVEAKVNKKKYKHLKQELKTKRKQVYRDTFEQLKKSKETIGGQNG